MYNSNFSSPRGRRFAAVFVATTALWGFGCNAETTEGQDEGSLESEDTGIAEQQLLACVPCPAQMVAYRNQVGFALQCTCPSAGTTGVYGTDIYTDDSSVCNAARHAGVIPASGGIVNVKVEPEAWSYTATLRNGVQSSGYGYWPGSFSVSAGGDCIPACPADLRAYRGQDGTSITCSCSSSAAQSGSVWGTNTYTDDSAVCRAAVHAGVITTAGGIVKPMISPGLKEYTGSTQNGVTSATWGYQWWGSYHFPPPSQLDPVDTCLGHPLLSSIGKDKLLVGLKISSTAAKTVAAQAPFDIAYKYLVDGIPDGAGPCTDCATGCTSKGTSCANGACGWWGCWQWDQDPPGDYVRKFIQESQQAGRIPMLTYYEIQSATGIGDGIDEVYGVADVTAMSRYFNDFRFMLQQIGPAQAFVHVEPDFWGYAQQVNSNPHAQPAAVASANPTDCQEEENSIAGMGRCMVKMARTYAPNVKIGLHGSSWGTLNDAYLNTDPAFNVAGEAALVGEYLKECAPNADFVVVETSDRDAQYDGHWWDPTNATLPNFHQAFAWAKSVAETTEKPLVWWQLPVGNMSLPGGSYRWRDNRLDYFFAHTDEIVEAHGVAMVFGSGETGQTDVDTDGGNLVSMMKEYVAKGRQPVGDAGVGDTCDTGLLGVCAVGTYVCENAGPVCKQTTQPSPEVPGNKLDDDCDGQTDFELPCNGKDDDLDGVVDEGAACTLVRPPSSYPESGDSWCASQGMTCSAAYYDSMGAMPVSCSTLYAGFVYCNGTPSEAGVAFSGKRTSGNQECAALGRSCMQAFEKGSPVPCDQNIVNFNGTARCSDATAGVGETFFFNGGDDYRTSGDQVCAELGRTCLSTYHQGSSVPCAQPIGFINAPPGVALCSAAQDTTNLWVPVPAMWASGDERCAALGFACVGVYQSGLPAACTDVVVSWNTAAICDPSQAIGVPVSYGSDSSGDAQCAKQGHSCLVAYHYGEDMPCSTTSAGLALCDSGSIGVGVAVTTNNYTSGDQVCAAMGRSCSQAYHDGVLVPCSTAGLEYDDAVVCGDVIGTAVTFPASAYSVPLTSGDQECTMLGLTCAQSYLEGATMGCSAPIPSNDTIAILCGTTATAAGIRFSTSGDQECAAAGRSCVLSYQGGQVVPCSQVDTQLWNSVAVCSQNTIGTGVRIDFYSSGDNACSSIGMTCQTAYSFGAPTACSYAPYGYNNGVAICN